MAARNKKVENGIKKLSNVEKQIVEGKRLYTLKESAVYLGRTINSMRELVWAKLIPVVQHGRKMWVDLADLEAYIDNHKAHA